MPQEPYHPSFPRPDDVNSRLWRYLSFGRFRWLVENRRLYMPRPEQLARNDNFEGTMPRMEAAWWDESIKRGEATGRADKIRCNKKRYMGFVRSYRTGWFISCWHLEEDENSAFWEIYGKDNQSVAIVTTFAKLEKALPDHILAGCVRYIDYETQVFETEGDKMPNLFDYIMHKRSPYNWEQEVRAVASAHSPAALGGDDIAANIVNSSYAPQIDPQQLISEIVVHPRASAEFYDSVGLFCEEHGLPAPRLSGLSFEPIS